MSYATLIPKDVTLFSAKRIAIAWKDTREARRAVVDALPLLDMAESVTIVEICGDEVPTKVKDVSGYILIGIGFTSIVSDCNPRGTRAQPSVCCSLFRARTLI